MTNPPTSNEVEEMVQLLSQTTASYDEEGRPYQRPINPDGLEAATLLQSLSRQLEEARNKALDEAAAVAAKYPSRTLDAPEVFGSATNIANAIRSLKTGGCAA